MPDDRTLARAKRPGLLFARATRWSSARCRYAHRLLGGATVTPGVVAITVTPAVRPRRARSPRLKHCGGDVLSGRAHHSGDIRPNCHSGGNRSPESFSFRHFRDSANLPSLASGFRVPTRNSGLGIFAASTVTAATPAAPPLATPTARPRHARGTLPATPAGR